MKSYSIYFSFILLFAAFFAEAQDKKQSNRLTAEVNISYGYLRWTKKVVNDFQNYKGDNDPIKVNQILYVYSGTNKEYYINFHYTIKKIGLGLFGGKNFFEVQPTKNSNSYGPAYNEVFFYGLLINYEIFRSNNFSIAPEIKGGSYMIRDKHDFYDQFHKKKAYMNTGVKFTYSLNRINFNLIPNTFYMYSENEPYSWVKIKEFRAFYNITFGVGIDILSGNLIK